MNSVNKQMLNDCSKTRNTKDTMSSNRQNKPKKQSGGRYKCNICEKGFRKPCLLQRHQVVHTVQKAFECTQCHKQFGQKSTLQRHIAHSHEGLKQHKCSECGLSFAQRSNLNSHLRQVHPVQATEVDSKNQFRCNRCACVYTKLNLLNKHKSTVHGKTQLNDVDEELADDPDALAQHVMEQLRQLQSAMQPIAKKAVQEQAAVEQSENDNVEHTIEDEAIISIVNLTDKLNAKRSKQLIKTQRVQRANGYSYYVCEFCAKEFHKTYDFIKHRRTHTKQRPYQCAYCVYTSKTNAELQTHTKRHMLDEQQGVLRRQHKCHICHKNYSSMRQLDAHMCCHLNTHTVRYICCSCHASYATKTAFSAHKHDNFDKELDALKQLLPAPIILSVNEGDVKTVETTKQSASEELALQTDSKQQCPNCKRLYATPADLKAHQRIHLSCSRRPYNCAHCKSKKFASQTQLRRHLKLCAARRNFKCVYCIKTFKSKQHCCSHMKTHLKLLLNTPNADKTTSELALNAPLTGLIAINENNSQSGTKLLDFQILPKVKTNKESVAVNVSETVSNVKQQESAFTCQFCQKHFQKSYYLNRHLLSHIDARLHACDQCSKRFKLKATLKQHQLTHATQRSSYACQVCGKQYAAQKVLNVHLRLHTGEKPFQCHYCTRSFRTSGHHQSHVRIAHRKEIRDESNK